MKIDCNNYTATTFLIGVFCDEHPDVVSKNDGKFDFQFPDSII